MITKDVHPCENEQYYCWYLLSLLTYMFKSDKAVHEYQHPHSNQQYTILDNKTQITVCTSQLLGLCAIVLIFNYSHTLHQLQIWVFKMADSYLLNHTKVLSIHSVSYTHLDVYKRQLEYSTNQGCMQKLFDSVWICGCYRLP